MGAGRAPAPVYLNLSGVGVGSWGRFPGERAACSSLEGIQGRDVTGTEVSLGTESRLLCEWFITGPWMVHVELVQGQPEQPAARLSPQATMSRDTPLSATPVTVPCSFTSFHV